MLSNSFAVIVRTEPGVYFYVHFRKPLCGLYVPTSLNFFFRSLRCPFMLVIASFEN